MRKNSYIFTAILAIVVSTGAWADVPANDDEREAGTVHEVYKPTELAESGIAGVSYVNSVGEFAGAAAAAAEAHAADASKSAYNAATAASNANTKAGEAAAAAATAQASADAADAAANSITNGDGITIEISDDKKKEITVKPKPNGGISVDEDGVAVDMGAGLKADPDGAVTINEGVGLKLEGNVLVPNLAGGDSVTITEGTGANADKLVISVHASDTILDAATNQVLNNVNEGTAITVTPTMSGGEVTDITISANTPTKTAPGVVEMPTYTEYQKLLNPNATPQQAYFGEDILDRKYGLSLETYMNAEAQQQLDLNATFTTLLDKEVSLPKDTSDNAIKNVGTNARPVYVNNGTAAAVESIAIPVDADNFENATTTAKIWIQ